MASDILSPARAPARRGAAGGSRQGQLEELYRSRFISSYSDDVTSPAASERARGHRRFAHILCHTSSILPRACQCARVHAARVPHPTNTSTNGGQDRRGNATCVSHGRSLCARAAAGYCHSMPGTVVRSADTHRGCVRCWALFAVSVSMNKSSIAASSAAIAITEDVNTLLVARRSRAPSSA